jgi:cytochrome c
VNNFELNKILGAVLVALLAAKVFDITGSSLVAPVVKLKKDVLIVAIPDGGAGAGHAAKEKELSPITPLLATANITNGEKSFKKCIQCHVIEKDKPHGIGPSLWGIVGRAIASLGDYAYSSALKEKASAVWDVEALNRFIHNPRKFAKGTKMTFMGIENDQERADIIAYLQKSGH